MTVNCSSRYPFITMNDFSRFIQQMNLLDENLDINSLDRIFIASNQPGTSADGNPLKANKDLNPDSALVRHKFVEALVRCAYTKYFLPPNIVKHEKKLSVALYKLINDLED